MLFILPLLGFAFFNEFYDLLNFKIKKFRPFKIILILLITLTAIGVSGVILSGDYGVWRKIKLWTYYPTLLLSFLIIVITTVYKAFRQKNIDARITFLGLIGLVGATGNDIMVNMEIYTIPNLLCSYISTISRKQICKAS